MVRAEPSATLHVLHVLRASRFNRARVGVPATPRSVVEDARRTHLDSRVREAKTHCTAEVVGHFAVGNPTNELLRLCTEVEANLLVIGTHEHNGLEWLLLGSISAALVRRAPCPVFVVRSQDAH